jgi:hypothetical protein
MVCWAGCETPVKDRTFETFRESLEFYRNSVSNPDCRIEEVTTCTKIKQVLPGPIIDFSKQSATSF